MDRRTGIAAAAAVTMVLIAGAFAAGANLGIVHARRATQRTGTVQSTTANEPQVITVDVQDPSDPTSPAVQAPSSKPGTSVQVIDVPVSQGSSDSREFERHDDSDEHESGEEGDD